MALASVDRSEYVGSALASFQGKEIFCTGRIYSAQRLLSRHLFISTATNLGTAGTVVDRLIQEAHRLIGSDWGWKTRLAEKLGIRPQELHRILSGKYGLGAKMQARLREVGADVDWIMTGRGKDDQNEVKIYLKDGDKLSPEMRNRLDTLVRYLIDHPSADWDLALDLLNAQEGKKSKKK